VSEIERDRFGRPLIYNPETEKHHAYTRVTTIAETQGDRYHLEKWLQRQVMYGAGIDPSLVEFARLVPDNSAKENKATLNDLVEQAHAAAKSSQRADDGTSLHDILHQTVLGNPVEIPAKWVRHVKEFQRVTADWTFLCNEQMVISDAHKYAGTPDAIVDIPGVGVVIADWKTGSSIELGIREMVSQLSMYAHADWLYEHDDDLGRRPMPEVSKSHGVIVHLDSQGGGALTSHVVDLEAGWEATLRSLEIRAWRRKKLGHLSETMDDGDPVEQWLRRRIMRLSANEQALPLLAKVLRPEWGSLTTGLDLTFEADMVKALDSIEDQLQLTFSESHPNMPKGRKKKNTT